MNLRRCSSSTCARARCPSQLQSHLHTLDTMARWKYCDQNGRPLLVPPVRVGTIVERTVPGGCSHKGIVEEVIVNVRYVHLVFYALHHLVFYSPSSSTTRATRRLFEALARSRWTCSRERLMVDARDAVDLYEADHDIEVDGPTRKKKQKKSRR